MLPERQKLAVRLLCIEEMQLKDVAALLGVHRGTVWRWKKTKAFRQEWQKVRGAYVRQWRRDMGFSDPIGAWRTELQRLRKKAEQEAAQIHDGNTKAFDAAWNAYRKHLMSGISTMQKRLKVR